MLSLQKLLIATNNPDKLLEIRLILDSSGWDVYSLEHIPPYPEPEENGSSLAENALIKARRGFAESGMLSLADDTGLEVDFLEGAPGIFSSRFAGANATYSENVKLLLDKLGVESNRVARFRTVMALVGEKGEFCWEGITEGKILHAEAGSNGFGYDPIFWSPWLGKTFAEASMTEKNEVSHRGRALNRLISHLQKISTM